MKPLRWIDTAVAVVGPLSFLSLIGFFLALHDIWWDYASPAVWAHAGRPLPDWYSPYNRTPVREREETREFGQFVDRGVPVMIAASSV